MVHWRYSDSGDEWKQTIPLESLSPYPLISIDRKRRLRFFALTACLPLLAFGVLWWLDLGWVIALISSLCSLLYLVYRAFPWLPGPIEWANYTSSLDDKSVYIFRGSEPSEFDEFIARFDEVLVATRRDDVSIDEPTDPDSETMGDIRFEVQLNGKPVCVSGIQDSGVLSATLRYTKLAELDAELDLEIAGLVSADSEREPSRYLSWSTPTIAAMDEIKIRVLPDGVIDPPRETTSVPVQSIEDVDFGTLTHRIDAWDGDIAFDCPPLTQAHIHLFVTDVSGPTDDQRQTIKDLIDQHSQWWPEVQTALIKCHSEITNADELDQRIDGKVGIHFFEDAKVIEMVFQFAGDPEACAYFVRLRDGTVAEVFTAD